MIYVIICCIILSFNILFFVYNIYNYKKKKENIYKETMQKINEEIENKRKEKEQRLESEYYVLKQNKQKEFEKFNESIQEKIRVNNQIVEESNKKIDYLLSQQKEIVDVKLQNYKLEQEKIINDNCLKIKADARSRVNEEIEKIMSQTREYEKAMEEAKRIFEEKEKEKLVIIQELQDFQAKRAALNEIQRKEEELEAEQDAHRIILSDFDKQDIDYLISIESKIHNVDVLHKLIWSEYLQKPFNQMINNIFGSKVPKNVIYCIQNIETGKKYIGKTSAEVSKRWTEHVKTSLGIGGVKKSKIHSMLFNNWDKFTFSVIEVVENANLSEREKYYINFFETDKYGYNIKSGG